MRRPGTSGERVHAPERTAAFSQSKDDVKYDTASPRFGACHAVCITA